MLCVPYCNAVNNNTYLVSQQINCGGGSNIRDEEKPTLNNFFLDLPCFNRIDVPSICIIFVISSPFSYPLAPLGVPYSWGSILKDIPLKIYRSLGTLSGQKWVQVALLEEEEEANGMVFSSVWTLNYDQSSARTDIMRAVQGGVLEIGNIVTFYNRLMCCFHLRGTLISLLGCHPSLCFANQSCDNASVSD